MESFLLSMLQFLLFFYTNLHFYIRFSVFSWLNHEFMFLMAMMVVECKLFIRFQMDHEQNINKFGRLNNHFHELEVEIKVAKVVL